MMKILKCALALAACMGQTVTAQELQVVDPAILKSTKFN